MNNMYCPRDTLDGCGGRLCRSCTRLLRRMDAERYPVGTDGEFDLTAEPDSGKICGFTSRERNRDGSVVIAGHGSACLRLTVAADSFGGIVPGDRVNVDGVTYRVAAVEGRSPVYARLLPEE